MRHDGATRGRPILNVFGWALLVLGVLIGAFFGIFTIFSVSALFAGPAGVAFALDVFWLPLAVGGFLIALGVTLAAVGGAMVRAAKPVDPRDLA